MGVGDTSDFYAFVLVVANVGLVASARIAVCGGDTVNSDTVVFEAFSFLQQGVQSSAVIMAGAVNIFAHVSFASLLFAAVFVGAALLCFAFVFKTQAFAILAGFLAAVFLAAGVADALGCIALVDLLVAQLVDVTVLGGGAADIYALLLQTFVGYAGVEKAFAVFVGAAFFDFAFGGLTNCLGVVAVRLVSTLYWFAFV